MLTAPLLRLSEVVRLRASTGAPLRKKLLRRSLSTQSKVQSVNQF
jgi:hypothetical protein